MRHLAVLVLLVLCLVLPAGCASSGTGSNATSIEIAKVAAHVTISVAINKQCQSGKIADCPAAQAQILGAVDTLIGDITARGVVDDAQRAAARAGLAAVLVKQAGLTQFDADLLVNSVGDLIVAALQKKAAALTPVYLDLEGWRIADVNAARTVRFTLAWITFGGGYRLAFHGPQPVPLAALTK